MNAPIFYLGAHHPHWLQRTAVPLFLSRRALARQRRWPRALGAWALDSGGFSELALHGAWTISAREYAVEVRRYRDEIGGLTWAAPQDWMCEPEMVRRTGLSVVEHQRRTLQNFLELRSFAPDLPFAPVLQGWTSGDYADHFEAYERAGVRLADEPVVGVGSICRRQATMRASFILRDLASEGLRLHAFGFKSTGLRSAAAHLVSADSMAWSLRARHDAPLEGHAHASCANCLDYALAWRRDLLTSLGHQVDGEIAPKPMQLSLFQEAA